MISLSYKQIHTVSSLFTREKGYTNINSNFKLPDRKAISLLNSFTPQGASPNGSLRVTSFEDKLGVGYYWMKSPSKAYICTYLVDFKPNELDTFIPPMSSETIPLLSQNTNQVNFRNVKPLKSSLPSNFSFSDLSAIFYSIIAGDNLLIVHSDPNERIRFIQSFFHVIPSICFRYNRFTSGCAELDGNENIVGVDELPTKFRSHKKLYLPLDTIFVDLVQNSVEGEGMKSSEFTNRIAELFLREPDLARRKISDFYRTIASLNPSDQPEVVSSLITRVQSKLGYREPIQEEWLMF